MKLCLNKFVIAATLTTLLTTTGGTAHAGNPIAAAIAKASSAIAKATSAVAKVQQNFTSGEAASDRYAYERQVNPKNWRSLPRTGPRYTSRFRSDSERMEQVRQQYQGDTNPASTEVVYRNGHYYCARTGQLVR
jgi:hypothetical protein